MINYIKYTIVLILLFVPKNKLECTTEASQRVTLRVSSIPTKIGIKSGKTLKFESNKASQQEFKTQLVISTGETTTKKILAFINTPIPPFTTLTVLLEGLHPLGCECMGPISMTATPQELLCKIPAQLGEAELSLTYTFNRSSQTPPGQYTTTVIYLFMDE